MDIDPTIIWNLILTIGGGSFVYWMRGMSQQVSDLKRRLADTREEVAKTYVTKEDLQQDMKEIIGRFDRMEEKFDRFIASRLVK
tara:strand:+ start:593 stop:844 length:252 start_codon:yes stop_codon:yes gene_type:complete